MTHAAAEDQVTGTDKRCLKRVRNDLRNRKVEAYEPCVVSLGCFHSGEYELNAFKRNNFPPKKLHKRDDELKKLSDKIIEVRGKDKRDDELNKLSDKIIEVQGKDIIEVQGKDIREWYGPDQNYNELGTNMAQDGLFLLQFLCQVSPKAAKNRKAVRYISHIQDVYAVQVDIMKLENQIPLVVLKTVFEWEAQTYQWILTGGSLSRDDVLESILRQAVWHTLSPFASPLAEDCVFVPVKYKSHLLEFVYDNIIAGFKPVSTGNQFDRKTCALSLPDKVLGFVYKKIIVFFESGNDKQIDLPVSTGNDKQIDFPVSTGNDKPVSTGNDKPIDLPRVEQLHDRGVKFAKQKGRQNLYKISFDRKTCTLKLPAIEMDHRTDAVMRNLLAFEVMEKAEKPLRCYLEMMNRLIDKAEDVQLLRKEGIIHSVLGSDQEVAETWNGMMQGLEKSTYEPIDNVIDEVVTFYTSSYRVLWAQFKAKYLSKPWLALALIGGCISLLLSVAQTILAWEQVRLQRETMK